MGSPLVTLAAHRLRQSALIRARTDLWWLATEILGYDKLTVAFHKPMLDRMDEIRSLRDEGKGRGRDTLWLWPREHYKTTVRKAQVIQDYLCDPTTTVTWWHAVEEMAQEVSVAIGTQLQKNRALRKLFPDGVLPSEYAKRFVGAKGFRLRSNRADDAPSFRAWGQTSEATGGHSKKGYLDDIIARNTIEDGAMPKVRSWYRQTVRHVVKADGWLDASGTRWDPDDIYQDWLNSKHWEVTVRAALEVDGVPDRKGKPVLFTRQQIQKKLEEIGESDFDAQMMNDPSPAGEKPWDQGLCEHRISVAEAKKGPGVIVVLSDPAPAKVGAFGEEKKRDAGEKDYWATCVVRLRTNGQRREIILLDGEQSKNWDLNEGMERICMFKRKWGTKYHAIEKIATVGADIYEDELKRVSRVLGVNNTPISLSYSNKSGWKNQQFARLAERAKAQEFMICESVPSAFLDAFLSQARNWRPLKGNRNSLKYDDAANAVSFAADRVFEGYTQAPDLPEFGPFSRMPESEEEAGSRWVRWSSGRS